MKPSNTHFDPLNSFLCSVASFRYEYIMKPTNTMTKKMTKMSFPVVNSIFATFENVKVQPNYAFAKAYKEKISYEE